tara:strand:- start:365 stop:1561 length:1197 start_codon:yes stop_codon:yes gene_type:complete
MEDMNLIKGDCIEELKKIPDQSVDFVYTDLPYNQTACSWDQKVIDLDKLWIELKRIAKNDKTPFFFSCTTKFGYKLIKANEKWFRWDLVWKKNRASGFLNAYKLPMRKHEMIYCFSKKCPEYDVSSHKESKTEGSREGQVVAKGDVYGKDGKKSISSKTHNERLPTSVIPPSEEHELVYCFAKKSPEYDVSSHSEVVRNNVGVGNSEVYGIKSNIIGKTHKIPLPTSVIPPSDEHELVYCFAKKSPEYDVSSHKEGGVVKDNRSFQTLKSVDLYGTENTRKTTLIVGKDGKGGITHNDPLPTSDITPPIDIDKQPPSSWCEFKIDDKTGHRTAKPVALMEFLLKYWTKPDSVVLDPTMGSGSMGIACKKMGRKFIGMELDDDIYKLAQKRISEAVVPK